LAARVPISENAFMEDAKVLNICNIIGNFLIEIAECCSLSIVSIRCYCIV
jgi:hypothetical protein